MGKAQEFRDALHKEYTYMKADYDPQWLPQRDDFKACMKAYHEQHKEDTRSEDEIAVSSRFVIFAQDWADTYYGERPEPGDSE